jgi:hypothetical protein
MVVQYQICIDFKLRQSTIKLSERKTEYISKISYSPCHQTVLTGVKLAHFPKMFERSNDTVVVPDVLYTLLYPVQPLFVLIWRGVWSIISDYRPLSNIDMNTTANRDAIN